MKRSLSIIASILTIVGALVGLLTFTNKKTAPVKTTIVDRSTNIGDLFTGDKRVITGDIEINTYDLEREKEEQKKSYIDFAHNNCVEFLEKMNSLSITDEIITASNFLYNLQYFDSETNRLFGRDIYKSLNNDMNEIQELHRQLKNVMLKHMIDNKDAHKMVDKFYRGVDSSAGLEKPEKVFSDLKNQIIARVSEHRDYLTSLNTR